MLPSLVKLFETAAVFEPLHVSIRYSLKDIINNVNRWRLAILRKHDADRTTPGEREQEQLNLAQEAINEYFLYRKWVVHVSAAPLALIHGSGAEEARMLRALARVVDGVEGGKVTKLSADQDSYMERILARFIADRKEKTAYIKQLDEDNRSITRDATYKNYTEQTLWHPLPGSGEFGAAAAKSSTERKFIDWLQRVVALDDSEATNWLNAVFDGPSPFDKSFDGGCLYSGVHGVNYDLTVEHIIPRDWTVVSEAIDELANVNRDSRTIALITASENSSRGTRPMSFFTMEARKEIGDVDRSVEMSIDRLRQFLYANPRFSERRKAQACRQLFYGFLTWPMLSDARKYAGSKPGDQMGSWLTWVQFKHARFLLDKHPAGDFEKLVDWVKFYLFGGCNPFIHTPFEQVIKSHYLKDESIGLLERRLRGNAAMSTVVLDVVTGRRDINAEADAAVADAPSRMDDSDPPNLSLAASKPKRVRG